MTAAVNVSSLGTAMVADANGNVGVGTPTPTTRLDVLGTANTVARVKTSSGGAYGAFHVSNSNANGEASIGYRDDSDSDTTSWVVGKSVGGVVDAFGWYYNGLRMGIDTAGRVTMPYQPYALCGFASNAALTFTSDQTVSLNVAEQRGGSNFNTSTSRFTAPVTGLYSVFLSLLLSPPSQTGNRLVLRKNGTDYNVPGTQDVIQPAMQVVSTGQNQASLDLNAIIYLNAGDFVTFAARSGSSVGPIYPGHSWAYFYLVG
jgi:hypothetical protein